MHYQDGADTIKAAIRPEHADKLTEAGKSKLAMLLSLACEWGAGDAYAGSLLMKGKADRFAEVLAQLGLKIEGRPMPLSYWTVNHMDEIADFLLEPEMAGKLKRGAISGRGFTG